jgi:hypothetical protein
MHVVATEAALLTQLGAAVAATQPPTTTTAARSAIKAHPTHNTATAS